MYSKICRQTTALPMLLNVDKNSPNSMSKWNVYIYIHVYIFKGEFEDTKEVIRICKSKDRQHNGQKKEDKQRSTHKTKDRVTRTSLKYIFLVIIFWLKTTKSYTLSSSYCCYKTIRK